MPLIATRGAASAQGFGEFGAVAGPAVYIEDVFSTYLYTGNGSTQTITNGIDLAGKGGLVWIKSRTASISHVLMDTNRGVSRYLNSNTTGSEQLATGFGVTNFGSTGFAVVDDSSGNYGVNGSGGTYGGNYASWTLREQPKFFGVVTYTGDGVQNRAIAHNLGSVPGCIIIKRLDSAINWQVYHRSLEFPGYLLLNAVDSIAFDQNRFWATPTATNFILGSGGSVNANGGTYVAYLFAHNAGGFGLTGTDNVISCGSWTDSGSGTQTITLGYEPQFLIYKRADDVSSWVMLDNMRGWPVVSASGSTANLYPNLSNAENGGNYQGNGPTATGFNMPTLGGGTYIYIAIRRGPMRTPTTGTSVFAPIAYTEILSTQTLTTGFPVDLTFQATRNDAVGFYWADRLRGSTASSNNYLTSFNTAAETNFGLTPLLNDNSTGVTITNNGAFNNTSGRTVIVECFRRAPGFFDVVCYTGTGSARTVNHNLAAVPEMMIVKVRSVANDWGVYNSTIGNNKYLSLNHNFAAITSSGAWNNTSPTSSVFTVGTNGDVNANTQTFIAYLFASAPGVSKVGSYTGTGTTKQIDCGFTGGARFVLIKRTDSTGDWYVWDSARGIVAGNDPYLLLNSNAAEVTNTDYIDTYSAGFEISSTAPADINANGGTFIFLAIA